MTDDLVQFLRARLDEDETTARESGGRWMVLPVTGWVHTAPWPSDEWKPPGVDHHVATVPLDGDRAHIVRHDPARVLAEVDAKRRMIDNFEMAIHAAETPPRPHVDMLVVFETSAASWRTALRLLALSYSDHPGYREEWRL
ncbi:DUF6221 family protein [Streptomyces virginiae]|uniref:DUF6221 family protein n=1 Tax=Streptomyces virginiae TaxID=1961 RepID=A0ABZ1TH37_STRVG|nr:DUF6221 family protein [Streptomyces virginiae]